ncbi:uncharacterized protein [Gossypium hirsutum]|uniref:Uncharacterized protein n=1 Tax=Gossypium hirsutum TaxID=3635 RepID=A0A1U8MLU3_GOSHI|nr:uncharacterized protein LOC107939022 [Gossypium hirsutum]
MVATKYERCVRFEDGLRDNLRALIAPQREWDFAVLLEKAKIAEYVKCAELQNREKDNGRNKRVKVGGPSKVGVPVATFGLQPCTICGKHHQGECWKGFQQQPRGHGQARGGNGMGRGRGSSDRGAGHTKVRQSTLVYAAHRQKDRDAPDVIVGTFFIRHVPYIALINVGSTHSYITCTMSEALGVMCENTTSEVTVYGLAVCENTRAVCEIKHQAYLDCATKRVVLKTVEGDEVVVIGKCRNYFSNVISVLRAEKMVRKGCEAYLAYVNASGSEVSSVKDIRTVKDFSDIFPDKLPGSPPNREVEFGIEIFLGTALVSIAPYRMAPKEFVELKA